MPANSLDGSFAVGIQTAKDTAATTYLKTLATVSGLNVAFDERDAQLEHPGPSARASARKAATQRTGYLTPWEATFLLRPRFIGKVLRGIGFGHAYQDMTTYDEHTFTIADTVNAAWISVIHQLPHSGTDVNRKAINCRANRLAINADTEQIQCEVAGTGLVEGNLLGSETYVSEIATELVPTTGSLTCEISAVALVTQVRGANMEITQTLREDDKALFNTARVDLPRQSIGVEGAFTGIDIDFDAYKKLTRGGTSGTAPDLSPVVGDFTYTLESSSVISGAVVPFSLTITVPSAEFRMANFQANGDDDIRFDLNWFMVDDTATPITIVLNNDQGTAVYT